MKVLGLRIEGVGFRFEGLGFGVYSVWFTAWTHGHPLAFRTDTPRASARDGERL